MLKQFRTYYFLLSSLLFIFSCNDDLPIPVTTEGEVVFEITATIDGQTMAMAAGKDNHFMFTNTEVDSNGVTLFQGTIGEVGCQFCPNSLGFEFAQTDGNTSYDALFTPNQTNITYRNSETPLEIIGYSTTFEITPQGTAPFTYDWDFGDGVNLLTSDPSSFVMGFSEPAVYHVCVEVTDVNGCQSTICKDVSTDNSMNCSVGFSLYDLLGNGFANSFFFHTQSTGVPPFNYQWNVSDSTTTQGSILASPTFTLTPNQLGTMEVVVNLTDDNNCNCSATQSVNFNNSNAVCLSNFSHQSRIITASSPLAEYFSTLNIRYMDENGVEYSSALGEQPTTSSIIIKAIEAFDDNSIGQSTKKITLEFACRLFDIDGNYIDLENGQGTIAIAHE